jgi:uncharacterized membrane protein
MVPALHWLPLRLHDAGTESAPCPHCSPSSATSAPSLVSAIAIEFALIRGELTLSSARRLQVTDLVLGIAAGLLLVIGLLRVFFFEKGADYYFHSHAFMAKFSVFIAIGLLSIIPTMKCLSWRGRRPDLLLSN